MLVAAAVGALLQWWRGPVYGAAVDVLVGPGWPGFSEDWTSLPDDRRSERTAQTAMLLGLVHRVGLAQDVLARMDGRLGGASTSGLLGRMRADLVTYRDKPFSDLIRITATGAAPQDAVDLATVWAEEYVASVIRLFQDDGGLAAIEQEVAAALQAGEQSQQRLEAFIAQSDLAALERRLAANEEAVSALWQVRNQAILAGAAGAGGEPPSSSPSSVEDAQSAIDAMGAESRALAADIAAAANMLALLTAERDAARSLAQAMRDEAADVRARRATAQWRVRLASEGAVLARQISASPYRVAAIAGAAATPALVVLALFANMLGFSPLTGSLARRFGR